jgi:hypothetical protein
MIARIPLLTGLLVAQLLILALLMLGGDEQGEAADLLSFDPAEVTALNIEDDEGNVVSLAAIEGEWRLGEMPADSARVAELIESLVGGAANWPVATSESSQARFEVAEDVFQRRVEFGSASGELATLYLGSSPGFRRIHAREAGQEAIFSIDFGVHELPLDASDWLNKQLFQVDSISSVTLPDGATLTRDDEAGWNLDGQRADAEAAESLVDRLAGLSVLGLHELSADTVLGDPLTVHIEDDDGRHELTFRFNDAADEYVLESDRVPGAFTVASYLVEQILVPVVDLLPKQEEADSAETPAEATAEAEVREG